MKREKRNIKGVKERETKKKITSGEIERKIRQRKRKRE